MWALTSWRHVSGMSAAFGMSRPKATQRRRRREARAQRGRVAGPGMMERLEERWRRRQEGG
jgi:hypothetical protein